MLSPGGQKGLYGFHQDWLDFGGNFARFLSGFIAAFAVSPGGTDIPGTIVTIGGHSDKEIGPHGFGGQLVFHKQFTRQVQDTGLSKR